MANNLRTLYKGNFFLSSIPLEDLISNTHDGLVIIDQDGIIKIQSLESEEKIRINWTLINAQNIAKASFLCDINEKAPTIEDISQKEILSHLAWGSDVSEKGFTRNGVAVNPEVKKENLPGSDQAKWLNISQKEMEEQIYKVKGPQPEVNVTQEIRQRDFDNYQTTDDHGMVIYGTAKDQNGTKYYLVKNSWGTDNKYKGIWYASDSFVKHKTINIVVHKDAIPKEILKKLGLK
jgi:hypothetical protein